MALGLDYVVGPTTWRKVRTGGVRGFTAWLRCVRAPRDVDEWRYYGAFVLRASSSSASSFWKLISMPSVMPVLSAASRTSFDA